MRALSGACDRISAWHGCTRFGSTFVTQPSVRWGSVGNRHQPIVTKNNRRPGPCLRRVRAHPTAAQFGTYQRRTLSVGGCHPTTPHQVPAAPREARRLGAVASEAERRAHTVAAAHRPSGDRRGASSEVRSAIVARGRQGQRSFSGRTSWCSWLPLGRRPRRYLVTVPSAGAVAMGLAGVTRAWPSLLWRTHRSAMPRHRPTVLIPQKFRSNVQRVVSWQDRG